MRDRSEPTLNGGSVGAGAEPAADGQDDISAMSKDSGGQHLERTSSYERVRNLVLLEGRGARNLISWHVPLDQELHVDANSHAMVEKLSSIEDSSQLTSPMRSGKAKTPVRLMDMRARYWSFMFDNLRRSIDAIYDTCLEDRSIIECKEAIMILEQSTNHFVELIKFLNAEADWELSVKPKSIAWEIRKTIYSPTKPYGVSPCQKKKLDFDAVLEKEKAALEPANADATAAVSLESSEISCGASVAATKASSSTSSLSSNTPSYADKVRHGSNPCLMSLSQTSEPVSFLPAEVVLPAAVERSSTSEATPDEDAGGVWEIVQRSKNRRLSQGSTMNAPSGTARPNRLPVFPKCAADIRQTKASLAKWQFNRRFVAQLRQKEEQQQQWQHAVSSARTTRYHPMKKGGSLPTLTGEAGAPPVWMNMNRRYSLNKRGRFSQNFKSSESLCSLQSIKEDDDTQDMEGAVGDNGGKLEDHVFVAPNTSGSCSAIVDSAQAVAVAAENFQVTTDKQKDIEVVSHSVPDGYNMDNDANADDEDAWQHLTEEERSLAEEERSLQKEIEEEENKSIDVEMERQQQIEDCEEAESHADPEALAGLGEPYSWQQIVERWKAEIEPYKWSELVEMELSTIRAPGQAVQVHEKLSSPSRKRPLSDTIRRHEERQAKAEELRQRLLEEKAQRLRDLSKKVQEVRLAKDAIVEKKRGLMDSRMAKAEQNRNQLLRAIMKKAHDEEEKVHEIAFINSLEADNKRVDYLSRSQDLELRLQSIQEERQKKQDEKAAREAAAEERRRVIESERQARLAEMAERRKLKELQIEQQKAEQERERQLTASQKARDREERQTSRKAAVEATNAELKLKIQIKQEESSRRYEESIEHIKHKANELSTPRSSDMQQPSPNGGTNVIAVEAVVTETSSTHVNDARKEKRQRSKGGKKRKGVLSPTAKLATKKGNLPCPLQITPPESSREIDCEAEFFVENFSVDKELVSAAISQLEASTAQLVTDHSLLTTADIKLKIDKCSRDLIALIESVGLDKTWLDAQVLGLERTLGELGRLLRTKHAVNGKIKADAPCSPNFVHLLAAIIHACVDPGTEFVVLPMHAALSACSVLRETLNAKPTLALHLISTPASVVKLQGALNTSFNMLFSKSTSKKLRKDNKVSDVLLDLLRFFTQFFQHLHCILSKEDVSESMQLQLTACRDLIQYVCSTGTVQLVTMYIGNNWKASSFNNPNSKDYFVECVRYVSALLKLAAVVPQCERGSLRMELERSPLAQSVSLLYTLLLNPSVTPEERLTPPALPDLTVEFLRIVFELFATIGMYDATLLQLLLRDRSVALEFRHMCSYLLTWCIRHNENALMHLTIAALGYFAVLDKANQDLLQSGSKPSVLQQLCLLPFSYFSDRTLSRVLLPSLIACCYENKDNSLVLQEELSGELLAAYIDEECLNAENKSCEKVFDVYTFRKRFPSEFWSRAKSYFSTPVV